MNGFFFLNSQFLLGRPLWVLAPGDKNLATPLSTCHESKLYFTVAKHGS